MSFRSVLRYFIAASLCAPYLSAASTETLSGSSATIPVSISSPTPIQISSATLNMPVVHGIHLTASAAGSKRYRANRLQPMLTQTMINTVVVDIKEEDGHVYIPGVAAATDAGAYVREIPDLSAWLAELKKQHIYTVGRVVVFKDNIMPRKHPSLGVHQTDGSTLWQDRKKMTWLDPYNRDAWQYVDSIAVGCAKAGFDEVQFDYLRFPTDGDLKAMRFSRPYGRDAASRALVAFLHQAVAVLHPLGVKVSIDIFGLTTSVNSGMGIGQILAPMAAEVDYVCPMTYPSHYARGEYGLANPNDQPYRTIHLAMRDALRVLGPTNANKLRPYFQDFSLKGRGIRYGPREVRAQLQAAADLHVMSWTLWNASCHYTLSALRESVIPGPPITKGEKEAPAVSTQTEVSSPTINSSK